MHILLPLKSSSMEELRKVGGTWDLSREPEDKVGKMTKASNG